MNFDNPFQKNAEMWQQWTTMYTDNLFDLFEKNLEQSRVFQAQMQTAVSQVVNSQFELVLGSLKTLEKQVAELNTRLNEMQMG